MKILVCVILTSIVKLSFGFENFKDSFMELNPLIVPNEKVTETKDEYGLNFTDKKNESFNYSNNIDTKAFKESEILVS